MLRHGRLSASGIVVLLGALIAAGCAGHQGRGAETAEPRPEQAEPQRPPTVRIALRSDFIADSRGFTWLYMDVAGPEPLIGEVAEVVYLMFSSAGATGLLEGRAADESTVEAKGAHPPHRLERDGALITQHAPVPRAQIVIGAGGDHTAVQPIAVFLTSKTTLVSARILPEIAGSEAIMRQLVDEPRLVLDVDTGWREMKRSGGVGP